MEKSNPLIQIEQKSLILLANGQSIKEIAVRIGKSPNRVGEYLKTVRTKVGAKTNEEALVKAIKEKYIEL